MKTSAMKINTVEKAESVVPVVPVGGAGSKLADSNVSAAPPHQHPTDETDPLKSLVARGMNTAASDRSERLQSLAMAVRAGAYNPIASRLADEILDQADLEARLAVYFR